MALALTGSRGGDMMSDRVKMTCPSCSYSCVPQWMNDEATCLKCFTVLRRRSMGAGVGAGVAVLDVRRQPGEVSTFKHSMVGAMESESGCCPKGPRGAHQWRFGKCSYCAKAEPVGQQALASKPTPLRTSSRSGSKPRADRFNFTLHTETAQDEVDVVVPPSPAGSSSRQRSSSRSGSKTRAGGHDHEAFPLFPEPSSGVEAKSFGARNDRTKVECPHCGYKCVPQWLNDRAHCLKCQAVLKVQESVHHSPRSSSVGSSGGGRRMPGEVSTYKVAPGDAMLHSSGSCARSPSGMHLWRFGRCDHCGKPEGKILGGGGAVANPGGSCVSSCSAGGKCMYKFAKCTKCGKKEF
mmetsp:Transcript_100948/g.282966  ORF Transcript_100948/g.282966 Transcript_100948/m.282966 type:complete len:351 (-) Transcript_100948:50-1102(-)